MKNHNHIAKLLALLLSVCMLLSLLPAASVFAADAQEMTVDDLLTQIESLRNGICKRGGKMTVEDFAALSDDVYALVKDSGTAQEGSLSENGSFVSWVDAQTGISCCYSPKHEADREGAAPSVDKEALAVSLAEMQGKLKRGGSPSSLNIGIIQPFWDSNSNYSDYNFRSYSPRYKAQAEALATYTGGALYRYTMGNATPDSIAYTLQNCGMVIFDSHGGTDYTNANDSSDCTSRANCSYIWLDSGVSSAAFISNADEYLLPADYATHSGQYADYNDYYLSSDGSYMVSGQLLANHMTGSAPNSLLYMGICLGMATDGMESPLRAKGVEAVYGYSQSVSFSGEVQYMEAITGALMENQTLGEAVTAAKSSIGVFDPGAVYTSYYGTTYIDDYPAYPIVVSSEDEYPGHGNVDAVQNVNSAWTLIPTVTVTATSNNTSYGTVTVSGRAIYATPANNCYLVSAEVTEGTGSCTVSGNNIVVHSTEDCTVLVTFAPKPEVTLSFSGIETAPITKLADSLVRLPSPTASYDGYTFVGWTEECADKTEDRPTFLKPGSYYQLPYEDVTLYALYSYIDHTEPAKPARYVELTSQKMLSQALETPGSYLIVWDYSKDYDGEVVVFNANTDSPTSDPNYSVIEASADGTIVSNTIIDSYAVRIAQIEGTETYSLQLMNGLGKYFGNTGGSNTINSKKSAYPMTIQYKKYSSYSSGESTLIQNAEGDTVRTMFFKLNNSTCRFSFYDNTEDCRSIYLYHYEPAVDGTLYYTGTPINCKHENAVSVAVSPTCTEAGYVDHLCSVCGYKWTEAGAKATGHSYVDTVTAPTATERGYTTHTCSVCHYSYQDSFVSPLGINYQVSYSVLGNVLSTAEINSEIGAKLPTTVAVNPKGYTFAGWSASEISQETTSATLLTGTYKPTKDITLYAVYRRSAPYVGSGDYIKVTAAPSDWVGNYLIVCEDYGYVFNGGLGKTVSALNVANNYLSVEIDDDRIPASAELNAAVITFAKASGTSYYTMKTQSGGYIGSSGSSTGMNGGTTAYQNAITWNNDYYKTVTIANVTGNNIYNFRYNSSTKNRFEFNTTGLKTGHDICLYKKDTNGTTYYFTTAPAVEDCSHTSTTLIVTDPTCTEPGYTTFICKNCGESWTGEQTAPLGHDYTYTANGDVHTVGCSRCAYTAEEAHTFTSGLCVCGRKELFIASAALTLNGKVDVGFTAYVPEDYDEPYMVFSGPNGEFTVTEYEIDGNGDFCFSYDAVNPQCMGDGITATLYATKDGEQEPDVISIENYSIRQYCVNQLKNETISAELRTLLSDMLAYGAAAQVFTGYNTNTPVNEGDDIVNLTCSEFKPLSGLKPEFSGESDDSVCWKSAGLTLTNSVAMNFTFSAPSVAGLRVEVKINDRAQSITKFDAVEDKENTYRFSFTGITATEFDEAVTATFYLGENQVGSSLTYSVNTYVCAKQNDSDANLKALVQTLYNYGASAKAFELSTKDSVE